MGHLAGEIQMAGRSKHTHLPLGRGVCLQDTTLALHHPSQHQSLSFFSHNFPNINSHSFLNIKPLPGSPRLHIQDGTSLAMPDSRDHPQPSIASQRLHVLMGQGGLHIYLLYTSYRIGWEHFRRPSVCSFQ